MSNKIGMESLGYELRKTLDEFEELSYRAIRDSVRYTAETVQKQTAGKSPKKTGAYKRNWKVEAQGIGSMALVATVYQNKKPSLTHLLQWGHGGPARAKGYPHIVPDQESAKIFAEKLAQEMRK